MKSKNTTGLRKVNGRTFWSLAIPEKIILSATPEHELADILRAIRKFHLKKTLYGLEASNIIEICGARPSITFKDMQIKYGRAEFMAIKKLFKEIVLKTTDRNIQYFRLEKRSDFLVYVFYFEYVKDREKFKNEIKKLVGK
jgi:hypothetical protein